MDIILHMAMEILILKDMEDIAVGVEMLKVSKFQKQIFLFSFEPKKPTKLCFDFCPRSPRYLK